MAVAAEEAVEVEEEVKEDEDKGTCHMSDRPCRVMWKSD